MQHRRGPWSTNEDQHLLTLVQHHGAHNWVRISQLVGTRSPKQCRERFHQNLKPALNHDPITQEEGELIERLVGEMGKRWAEIARRLKGRSDNAVKNWWNGGVNRRKRLCSRNLRSDDGRRRLDEHSHHHHHHHHHYSMHVPRKAEDALPSPPLSSTMSRADSKEPTPSLVSDSYSTLSNTSPRLPASPLSAGSNHLPPLVGHNTHHHSHSYPYGTSYAAYQRRSSLPISDNSSSLSQYEKRYDTHSSGSSSEGYSYHYLRHTAPDGGLQPPRPFLQLSQKSSTTTTTGTGSYYQEPRTPCQTQAASSSSLPPTPASPKDNRMNISSILA